MKHIVYCLLSLVLCIACQQYKKYTYQKFIIGALSEITFYCNDDSLAQDIIEECDNELIRLHASLNRFSDSSLVSMLNKKHRIAAPEDIIQLVDLCDSISYMTDGLFDISIGPFMEIWGYYQHEYQAPDSHHIHLTKKYVDYRKIVTTKDSIFIAPFMKIDFGGIAQGYAADRVAMILRNHGITSALINIGGEIVAIGRSPEQRSWRIGIKHPRNQGIIETVEIENYALSTSGDYEKFFIVGNKRLPHIIDPTTGYPARGFASVTIFAQSAAFADAIATATAIMGAEKGLKFLDFYDIQGIIYYEEDSVLLKLEHK